MRMTNTILLCLCITLAAEALSQARGWRGIVPLHSTRADVERLLGPPAEPGGEVYKLETEVVLIEYSSGPCNKDRRGGWNIPRDVVVSINVAPKTELRFSELHLDERIYKKTLSGDATSFVNYANEEEGITYEVHEPTERVTAIYFGPTSKDRQLRCPDPPTDKHCKAKQGQWK
jgi:hypothetical protein